MRFCSKYIRGSGGTKLTAGEGSPGHHKPEYPGQVRCSRDQTNCPGWLAHQHQPVIVNNAEHWMVIIVVCYFNPSSGSVIVNDFNSTHKVDTEWDSPPKYFRFKKVAMTRCQWGGDGGGLAGIRKQQLCVVITIITANCDGLSLFCICPVSAMETVAQNQDYIETRCQLGQTLQ